MARAFNLLEEYRSLVMQEGRRYSEQVHHILTIVTL